MTVQAPTPQPAPPSRKPLGTGAKVAIGCGGAFGLFLLLAIIIGVASSGSTPGAASGTANASNSAPAAKGFAPGMYKVGTDIPAGEYLLLGDSSCYFQVDRDSSGDFNKIVCNDNFTNRSIISVSEGQYITVKGARLIPFADAIAAKPENGFLDEGMYKVGKDIQPGEYKIIPEGQAYVEVAKNSKHDMMSILTNDNFDAERYIALRAGTYLKFSDAKLKMNP